MMSKHTWEYCDKENNYYTFIEIDGIEVKLTQTYDEFIGYDYLLECYEYLEYETMPFVDMTDLADVDELHQNGEITDEEHMQAHAMGYRIVNDMQFDIFESARLYQKISGQADFAKCLEVVNESVERIDEWFHNFWHFVTITAEVVGHEDEYCDSCGGYESYLFETGKDEKYGDEILEDMAKGVAHAYKVKNNYAQKLLPI